MSRNVAAGLLELLVAERAGVGVVFVGLDLLGREDGVLVGRRRRQEIGTADILVLIAVEVGTLAALPVEERPVGLSAILGEACQRGVEEIDGAFDHAGMDGAALLREVVPDALVVFALALSDLVHRLDTVQRAVAAVVLERAAGFLIVARVPRAFSDRGACGRPATSARTPL